MNKTSTVLILTLVIVYSFTAFLAPVKAEPIGSIQLQSASPTAGGYYTWLNGTTVSTGTYYYYSIGAGDSIIAVPNSMYLFSYWVIDGTARSDGWSDAYGGSISGSTFTVTFSAEHFYTAYAVFSGPFTPTPPPVTSGSKNYTFTFKGLYNETNALLIDQNVTVTAYSMDSDYPNTQFTLDETYNFNLNNTQISHFKFELGDYDREYWISSSNESVTGTIYVFNDTLTNYVLNFMDLVGATEDYPYVEARYYANGTLLTMEKRKIDVQGSISMNLVNGRTYELYLIAPDGTEYHYGSLLMTDTTNVQLVLRGVDFPKDSLLLYKYVRANAVRDFLTPYGAVTVSYEDTLNETNSVLIQINYSNGTLAYNTTITGESLFSSTWNSAVNNQTYLVVVTIDHDTLGELVFKQTLPGKNQASTAPFGLEWLGDSMPFETAYFIPALIIILVAGCFSEVTAEVAGILTVITAIVLTAMGWIEIGSGALVTAFALAVMLAIVQAKRRLMY